MPTNPPPSLIHKPLDWSKDPTFLLEQLNIHRQQILVLTGFKKEYDGWDTHIDVSKAADQLLADIASQLAWVANDRLHRQGKAPSQLIANLKAILHRPLELSCGRDKLDPETMDVLENGFRGTFGRPLSDDATAADIREVARSEIASAKLSLRRGARKDDLTPQLAERLAGVFGSRGAAISRVVNRKRGHQEQGRFSQFLELVLPPLNALLKKKGARPFSVRAVAEAAATLRREIKD